MRYGYVNLIAYALLCADDMAIEESGSYTQAVENKDIDKWIEAMRDEMDSLLRNKT